jgi:hypothetical protein
MYRTCLKIAGSRVFGELTKIGCDMITNGEFLPCNRNLNERSTMLLVLAMSTIITSIW